MKITGTVQHQAWQDKVLPPVEQVRPGLWSFPVPLPDNPLRYVLVYGLELPDGGIALVDAGWDTPEAWDALCAGLATAGCEITDVRAVLVTHLHPDHYGLAGRIREASGAWVALHPADAGLLRARYTDFDGLIAAIREQMAVHGVPDEEAGPLADASRTILPLVRHTDPEILLEDGEQVPIPGWRLRTVWTPGHSPGHVCFLDPDRRLLLSGDHVLPRITPAISVHPQQRHNPLADFFDSLDKVRGLDVEEVLPAHEYRFAGLADRVAALAAHHTTRLDEIALLVIASGENGATAWELARRLTWSRPWEEIQPFMRRTAMLETLAHLVMLAAQQRVRMLDGPPVRWRAMTG
ncbi:MBL fold metallo-hydrolase [Thermomonospora cellulosilytica]|uniref:Glyoxylase-like metal-dependent hydrolase (Beta-lactamase superfamily II) n=1 Tax=Thermomonospora cellulosilytica TaxID=1411118 RepID=A0A7W3N129_9ACTN|nr:MBL fold metallo-hydrolase [Thermomonospora cellulosilytica]MBA9005555.1 glyoxylase-like metal-dependent hydrolase (beta-lactamase superfamily II) [Thermomonospora cellulosilytica]